MTRFIRCNRAGEQIGDLEGVVSAIRSRTVDSDDNYGDATCDKLTVTLYGDIEEGDRILYLDSMGEWAEWVAKVPDTQRAGSVPITTCKCISSFEYDLEGKWIESLKTKRITARVFLESVLEGTVWLAGTVDPAQPQMSDNGEIKSFDAYKQDGISSLHGLCNVYGYEMYSTITCDSVGVTSRHVHLVNRRGDENPIWRFEYRRDLKDIRRTYSGGRVLTKAHIFGKGQPIMNELNVFTGHYDRKITIEEVNQGKDYLEDTSLIPYFGTLQSDGTMGHTEGRIDFEQCEDVSALLELGRAAFNEQKTPKVNYEASVIALAKAGMDFGGCSVGDAVQIVDTSFNEPLRLEGRVLAIEEDLLRGADSIKLTLGNIVSTRGKELSSIKKAVQQASSSSFAWNSLIGGSSDYLTMLLNDMNGQINATGGYTYIVEGNGIRTYDAAVSDPMVGAEASQVVEIKGGSIRIADSKNQDGTWRWRTVFTSGLVAADVLSANNLITGIIQDASGRNRWNLETGELVMQIDVPTPDISVGATNLLDDTDAPSLTKVAAAYDRSWSGNSGAAVHSFEECPNPPIRGIDNMVRFTVTTASSGNSNVGYYSGGYVPVITGEEYTMSCYMRIVSGAGKARFHIYNGSSYKSSTVPLSGSGWQHVSWTFTVDDNVTQLRFYYGIFCDVIGVVDMCGMKLERGNVATDWSPSNADVSVGAEISASDAVDAQTQQDIFNKLTNYGQAQGLFLDQSGGLFINGNYIQAATVKAAAIASNAITTDKINAGAISTAKLADDAVTIDKIDGGEITADWLADNAVTSVKIAGNAVTAGKIASNAVTAGKIASGAITTGKLAAGAVTTDKIDANAVTADKIDTSQLISPKVGESDTEYAQVGTFSYLGETYSGIELFANGGNVATYVLGVHDDSLHGGGQGTRIVFGVGMPNGTQSDFFPIYYSTNFPSPDVVIQGLPTQTASGYASPMLTFDNSGVYAAKAGGQFVQICSF